MDVKEKMKEAIASKDPEVINKLGNELAASGDYASAIDLFGEALCMYPFNEKLRGSRGRKYIGAFNYMASIADLSLATRLNPNDWEHWYYMGVAAYLGGKYELAKECHTNSRNLMYKYGIEAIPATVDWYWMACMKLGQKEEAEKILDLVYEGMPTEDGDYLDRVLLYKGVYKPENFVEDHMCTGLSPERTRVYYLMLTYGLANYHHYLGDQEKAVELCKEIAASPDWHNLFAYAQAKQNLKEWGIE